MHKQLNDTPAASITPTVLFRVLFGTIFPHFANRLSQAMMTSPFPKVRLRMSRQRTPRRGKQTLVAGATDLLCFTCSSPTGAVPRHTRMSLVPTNTQQPLSRKSSLKSCRRLLVSPLLGRVAICS